MDRSIQQITQGLDGRHRQSAGRSSASAAVRPLGGPGSSACQGAGIAPSLVVSRCTARSMARGAEAGAAAIVAAADTSWLKQGFQPPEHADLRRSGSMRGLFIRTHSMLKRAVRRICVLRSSYVPGPQRQESTGASPFDIVSVCERPAEFEDRAWAFGRRPLHRGRPRHAHRYLVERGTASRFSSDPGHDDCLTPLPKHISSSLGTATLPDLGSRPRDTCPRALPQFPPTSSVFSIHTVPGGAAQPHPDGLLPAVGPRNQLSRAYYYEFI